MTAQIKVRVQRKAIVKFKVLPRIPASIVAGAGILINKSGATYTFSTDSSFTPVIAGGFPVTFTAIGVTNLTLPTTGTLVTLAGTETLSNKTFSNQTIVNLNAAPLPSLFSDTVLKLGNANGTGTRLTMHAYANSAVIAGVRANGTPAASTALANGEIIFALGAYGHDGTTAGQAGGTLIAYATQGWTNTAHGGGWIFQTVANGTTTLVSSVGVENDGGLTLPQAVTGGSKGPGTINVSGPYYVAGTALKDVAEALTNKTISGASNTITNISLTSGVTGRLPFANLTQGSARSVLGVTGNATVDFASIQGTSGQVLAVPAAGTSLAFTPTPFLGVAGSTLGAIGFGNTTSGTITLQPVTGALGSVVVSIPAATDTLVGKATTDTLTNKTFDTSGTGNSLLIAGLTVSANTGTGSMVRATAPTIAGGAHTALTSFGIRSTGSGAFDLRINNTENITANRTITISTSDADRTIALAGNLVVPSTGAAIPATAQGDILYASTPGVFSALAKTASASRFLKNSGTSNNPAWAQPDFSDLSGTPNAGQRTSGMASFSANKAGTNQTGVADATFTKVTFTTEAFDVGSFYDAANSKWTPPAGKVLITAALQLSGTLAASAQHAIALYKNGSRIDSALIADIGGANCFPSVTTIDDANGTDFYEIYCFIDTSAGTGTVNGDITETRFRGTLI